MDYILLIAFGFLFAVILHELTHLLVIAYYKIPIQSIIITKWSAFGFLVDNECYLDNEKIMALLYFSPLIWCFVVFINPGDVFFLMFPIVNIFGGIGDVYYFLQYYPLTFEERMKLANESEEKVKNSIVWRLDL